MKNLLKLCISSVGIGVQSIINDEYSRMKLKVPVSKHEHYFFIITSVFFRYCLLLPIRIMLFAILLLPMIIIVYLIPRFDVYFFKFICFTSGLNITHYGQKNHESKPTIYVANHTSYFDYIAMSSHKFSHLVIAQDTPGLFNFFLSIFSVSTSSISFDRNNLNDSKETVNLFKRLCDSGKNNLLIFPEGVCLNNIYSTLFFKTAFSYGVQVVPVMIKYDPLISIPHFFFDNIILGSIYYMSRWDMKVDIFWTKPTEIQDGESVEEFSHRIKHYISHSIKLRNTLWNGFLLMKRYEKTKNNFQEHFQNTVRKIHKPRVEFSDFLEKYYPKINYEPASSNLYFENLSYEQFFLEVNKDYYRSRNNNKL